jgi:type I restriction enzyme R subunit
MKPLNENTLVEQPTVNLLTQMGWEWKNCFEEQLGLYGTLGRETTNDVVIKPTVMRMLRKLNPDLPETAHTQAYDQLTKDRSILSLVNANKEIYKLLKDGIKVTYRNDEGREVTKTLWVIDFLNPDSNEYLITQQLWVSGEIYKRRPDLVGFVNGLPLVFIELKATHRNVKSGFNGNLRDYKDTIPQIFWYNQLVILSNGSEAKLGTISSAWEHFFEWKKIESEDEDPRATLENMLRGVCDKHRLCDLIENFTIFTDAFGAPVKLISKNHQYLGVNNVMQNVYDLDKNRGQLGVYWHTQGSGKSISMMLFSQKVLRKIPGNWTFVIVTDRTELDDQIYQNFADAGIVTEPEQNVRAGSINNLRQLLVEDHRFIFTTIQKFQTRKGESHPVLSDRSDVIVMTDEAHRTQYDVLAMNMRTALPNAGFLGFTGTPLIAGEEKTKAVFGGYVSKYDYKQSVEDGATVPLFYENRIPQLQLANDAFDSELNEILEQAELDEDQEVKLEKEFARQYHLITREDRLDTVARDIVSHYMSRGYMGKAMVVSIDKATALKMYNKVQKYLQEKITELQNQLDVASTDEKERLIDEVEYLLQTDMAVVVSQSQNEVADMREKGLDIRPHRQRMMKEDLATKFKDPNDPFRIVFVCAMWFTGFDAPSISTLYLDKPMKNHTLMQTMARANRVFKDKPSGTVVDYIGIFRSLQKALAIYGDPGGDEGKSPIKNIAGLVEDLRKLLIKVEEFLEANEITIQAFIDADPSTFERSDLICDAANKLLITDKVTKKYTELFNEFIRLYKAVLPSQEAMEFAPQASILRVIAKRIQSLKPEVSIDHITDEIERLLDRSISPEGFGIDDEFKPIDISKVDFEALKEKFTKPNKRVTVERLKQGILEELGEMIRKNKTRVYLQERFEQLIREYNNGALNLESLIQALENLARDIRFEEGRNVMEGLSEEELAIFDLLTRPAIELDKKEYEQVKQVAQNLIERLKKEALSLDWKKKQQERARVKTIIEVELDHLPTAFDKELFLTKCDSVFYHVYDAYQDADKSVYRI